MLTSCLTRRCVPRQRSSRTAAMKSPMIPSTASVLAALAVSVEPALASVAASVCFWSIVLMT